MCSFYSYFEVSDAYLSWEDAKLGGVKVAVNLDKTTLNAQTLAVEASMYTQEDQTQVSTTANLRWSNPALFAEEVHLTLGATGSVTFLELSLQTAVKLDYKDDNFLFSSSLKDSSGSELTKLDARGRYKESPTVWFVFVLVPCDFPFLVFYLFPFFFAYSARLLAADDVSVYMGGEKLVTVASAIDYADAMQGALQYFLLVHDGASNVIASTTSSVTWTKPSHTTWEEAGKFRVKSVFHPLFSDPANNSKCFWYKLPIQ